MLQKKCLDSYICELKMLHTIIWSIWLERNKRTFENSEESVGEIWIRIKFRNALWISCHKNFREYHFSDILRSLSILL